MDGPENRMSITKQTPHKEHEKHLGINTLKGRLANKTHHWTIRNYSIRKTTKKQTKFVNTRQGEHKTGIMTDTLVYSA